MIIRLVTLGGLQLFGDDVILDGLLGQRSRAAFLVYLAVERRVSRESLTTVFWPESDSENARHALRQSLYHLRKALGPSWIEARAHELHVSADTGTDVDAFTAALKRGSVEAAARLYSGAFLDGVNLLDVSPWESWVDGRRAQYAREFRKACRDWVDARRAAGDLGGAIEAAQHWVAPDPFDDEAQHRLIEALADAGEKTEAIRQFETYARLLEPDGLRPLDHTVDLVERTRLTAAPWPDLPNEAAPPTVPAATDLVAPPTPASTPAPTRAPTPERVPSIWQYHAFRYRPTSLLAGLAGVVLLLTAFWLADPRRPASAFGSLVTDGERIVLADFGGPAADPTLGAIVTDALRIDLLGTTVLRVLDSSDVRQSLERMQLSGDAPLTADLAREVALREGVKAVLEGEIAQAGTGYVLTAALRSARSDRILAAFRETATGPDDVIAAIDRLSRQIRRRAGEPLRWIEGGPELARVTTASLDALRIYGEAERALHRHNYSRVVPLLEEALEYDPDFAMAWRLLAVTLGNTQWDRAREVEAATRAYELRHRLSPRERHLATAAYHAQVTRDHDARAEAYHRVLELDPDDEVALNNLGLLYRDLGDYEAAATHLGKAIDRPDPSAIVYGNLVNVLLAQDRLDEARAEAAALSARYPAHMSAVEARFWVRFRSGDEAGARAQVEPVLTDLARSARERGWAHDRMARLALWRGRLGEARDHMEAAERVVRDAGPPFNAFAWRLSRAHTEVMVGDPDRGVRLLLQGIDDGLLEGVLPADRHYSLRAIILGMADRLAEAEAVLGQLEAEVPPERRTGHDSGDAAARGVIRLQRGDAAGAVRALERARASQHCRFCFAEWTGRALQRDGQLQRAAVEWETVMGWNAGFDDPGFQVTRYLWVLERIPALYEQLGDTARALHHYRRLVALWQDADAELQPRVEHARNRIAALQQQPAERAEVPDANRLSR